MMDEELKPCPFCGGKAKVKAAGGVRTPEDMVKIVAAGADRIGTSAGCSLVKK